MTSPDPYIVLDDVSKVYPLRKGASVLALDHLDLTVSRGEFVVITGRSGSGKTTLLNVVSGLTRPSTGTVILGQTELWRLSDVEQSAFRNEKIGFVFQFPSLIPSLTVLENVVLPTIAAANNHRTAIQERAIKLLEEVGLADKVDVYPRQLSAGQQQRVVVARSLINQPELLLADEPTSNLDEQTEEEIMSLIQRIYGQRSITILLVTHSTELTAYGTRSVRMATGKIV